MRNDAEKGGIFGLYRFQTTKKAAILNRLDLPFFVLSVKGG